MKTQRLPFLAFLGATLVAEALADRYCCFGTGHEVGSCNGNCWPWDRLTRWIECGRRGDADCKYEGPPGSVRTECCYSQDACFIEEPQDCYLPAHADGFDSSLDEVELTCTVDGPFTYRNVPSYYGFGGTICGSDGFGGLDPHFQVRSSNTNPMTFNCPATFKC